MFGADGLSWVEMGGDESKLHRLHGYMSCIGDALSQDMVGKGGPSRGYRVLQCYIA